MKDKETGVILTEIKYIKKGVDDLRSDMKAHIKDQAANYVTKLEFNPVKRIVFGIAGLTLTGVFGAILSLVIK